MKTNFTYAGKARSESRTIKRNRIDNLDFAIKGGTVSRLPLSLLPNGTPLVRYEPQLMRWVLLILISPIGSVIYLERILSFALIIM